MTASTSTHPSSKKQTTRPSVWRLLAAKYADLLFCGFTAWVISFALGAQSQWLSVGAILFVLETLWCRDRLNPTAGEYCLGIRYLTSSSSQVVADIQVIHNKLKLNAFLVVAGIVELTLAVLFLGGWTFLGKAAFLGISFGPPLSLVYWICAGLAFFFCGGALLGGSRLALWTVPAIHTLFASDFFLGTQAWKGIFLNEHLTPPILLKSFLVTAGTPSFPLGGIFILWSLSVFIALLLSRKHLVN